MVAVPQTKKGIQAEGKGCAQMWTSLFRARIFSGLDHRVLGEGRLEMPLGRQVELINEP